MSPMTVRDFTLVAETLKTQRHFVDNDAVDIIAIALSDTFSEAYFNVFSRTEFLELSGVTL